MGSGGGFDDLKDEDRAGDDAVLIFNVLKEGCGCPKDLRCDIGVNLSILNILGSESLVCCLLTRLAGGGKYV